MNYLINVATAFVPSTAVPGMWKARIRNTTTDAVTMLEAPALPITWADPANAVYEVRVQRYSADDLPLGPVREQQFTLPLAGAPMVEVVGGDITVTPA